MSTALAYRYDDIEAELDADYSNVVSFVLKKDPRTSKEIARRIGTTPRTVENWRDGLNEPRGRLFFKLAHEIPELRAIALKWLDADNGNGDDPTQLAEQLVRALQARQR